LATQASAVRFLGLVPHLSDFYGDPARGRKRAQQLVGSGVVIDQICPHPAQVTHCLLDPLILNSIAQLSVECGGWQGARFVAPEIVLK
jgi:hypothetical protein